MPRLAATVAPSPPWAPAAASRTSGPDPFTGATGATAALLPSRGRRPGRHRRPATDCTAGPMSAGSAARPGPEGRAELRLVPVAVEAARAGGRGRRRRRPRPLPRWATGGRGPACAPLATRLRPSRGAPRATKIAVSRAGAHPSGIVQPGTRPAEVGVAGGPMADHGVEGIHRPIAEGTGRAGDGPPQGRRHHRVDGVLGHRLDDGPGDVLGRPDGSGPAPPARGGATGPGQRSPPPGPCRSRRRHRQGRGRPRRHRWPSWWIAQPLPYPCPTPPPPLHRPRRLGDCPGRACPRP